MSIINRLTQRLDNQAFERFSSVLTLFLVYTQQKFYSLKDENSPISDPSLAVSIGVHPPEGMVELADEKTIPAENLLGFYFDSGGTPYYSFTLSASGMTVPSAKFTRGKLDDMNFPENGQLDDPFILDRHNQIIIEFNADDINEKLRQMAELMLGYIEREINSPDQSRLH